LISTRMASGMAFCSSPIDCVNTCVLTRRRTCPGLRGRRSPLGSGTCGAFHGTPL
jgi:hypothetical protein